MGTPMSQNLHKAGYEVITYLTAASGDAKQVLLNLAQEVDLVVCLALCVTVIVAKVVGCMLPMAAKAMKLDPAVMASPFITTIVDALSLLVYFLFAKGLLNV